VSAVADAPAAPLCVDLDGTLIISDLLLESALLLIKSNPLYLFMLPLWLLRGKSTLKAEIARRVELNPALLPYNRPFLEWLKTEKVAGRSLWLCTASTEKLATAVATHLALFDGVLASDSTNNLAGRSKAQRLIELFGERGFDYCGNESRDLAVWKHAHAAIVVDAPPRLAVDAARVAPVARTFPGRGGKVRALVRALRPHQWAKNVLVFVPLVTAHRTSDLASLRDAALSFVAFCFCASSVYIINDLLDLEADRAHPRKSRRPFAAGDASIVSGVALAAFLIVVAIGIALLLPARFQIAFAGYYILTLGYSLVLKGRVLFDTFALAGLYTIRIVAGGGAAKVALSFWLLLFSVFLFLSLALVKRFAELESLRRRNLLRAAGRGYFVEDLPVLQSMGTASGYLSVLVLALYINSPDIQALYHRPKVIWFLCVLMLYWISRIWIIAQRGFLHEDPVVYAFKDRMSILTGILIAVTVAAAI
jgi:4-hydroxybenzoate polyprenyltransferase/phosphoserine phosphatase